MQKRIVFLVAVFVCFMACFTNAVTASAITTQEVKERWYETRTYPYYLDDSGWHLAQGAETWEPQDMDDSLDVLNPPLDLLLRMSAEELAKLMQEYPSMGQIMTYFGPDGEQDYATFFSFIESEFDIFYELLRRDDGITCLLEAYRAHPFDVQKLNDNDSSFATDQMLHTEIFGCQFIRYYSHLFTEAEYTLARQIIAEKQELYSDLNATAAYYLDLPELLPPAGGEIQDVRTNYLTPEEIQEKNDKLLTVLQSSSKNENLQPDTSAPADNGLMEEVLSPEDAPTEKSSASLPILITIGAVVVVLCTGAVVVLSRQKKKR